MRQIKKEPLDSRYENGALLTGRWAEQAIGEAKERIDRLLPRFSGTFPSASTVHGMYQPVEKVDWTEGFWTGMLWLLYEVTGDAGYRRAAERFLPTFRERLDQKIKVNTHDLGFLYSLSCVAASQLTGNETARQTALDAAKILYGRYNETAGIIQAWGDLNDPAKQGRMIIDCNLNLPLLGRRGDRQGRLHSCGKDTSGPRHGISGKG